MADNKGLYISLVTWISLFLFVGYMSTALGYQMFSGTEAFDNLVGTNLSAWDFLNPLVAIDIFSALFQVSSGYAIINTLIVGSFGVRLLVAIIFIARGIS